MAVNTCSMLICARVKVLLTTATPFDRCMRQEPSKVK